MREPTEDRGFSLLETLIACALLATALLSIGHLSTAAIVLLMDSRASGCSARGGAAICSFSPLPLPCWRLRKGANG